MMCWQGVRMMTVLSSYSSKQKQHSRCGRSSVGSSGTAKSFSSNFTSCMESNVPGLAPRVVCKRPRVAAASANPIPARTAGSTINICKRRTHEYHPMNCGNHFPHSSSTSFCACAEAPLATKTWMWTHQKTFKKQDKAAYVAATTLAKPARTRASSTAATCNAQPLKMLHENASTRVKHWYSSSHVRKVVWLVQPTSHQVRNQPSKCKRPHMMHTLMHNKTRAINNMTSTK
mmetsp:Transcript_64131/g.185904  ORF Transcript_64131/g.185904 Transcript_64131/m.185904 type:complete len:231 (+) Transcript_64131:597-1289(+)